MGGAGRWEGRGGRCEEDEAEEEVEATCVEGGGMGGRDMVKDVS